MTALLTNIPEYRTILLVNVAEYRTTLLVNIAEYRTTLLVNVADYRTTLLVNVAEYSIDEILQHQYSTEAVVAEHRGQNYTVTDITNTDKLEKFVEDVR